VQGSHTWCRRLWEPAGSSTRACKLRREWQRQQQHAAAAAAYLRSPCCLRCRCCGAASGQSGCSTCSPTWFLTPTLQYNQRWIATGVEKLDCTGYGTEGEGGGRVRGTGEKGGTGKGAGRHGKGVGEAKGVYRTRSCGVVAFCFTASSLLLCCIRGWLPVEFR